MKRPDPRWQRETALAKIARDRRDAEQDGAAMSDRMLAAAAAGYVGASIETVLGWMGRD